MISRVRYQSGSLPVWFLRNFLRTINGINPKDTNEIASAIFMARVGAAAFLVFFSAFAAAAFFAAFAAAAFCMVKNREGQKDDRNGARSTDPQRNQGMLELNCCHTTTRLHAIVICARCFFQQIKHQTSNLKPYNLNLKLESHKNQLNCIRKNATLVQHW